MMTIDDEGEGGGGLANDDVITETQIFGIFRGIFPKFSYKFTKSGQNFQLFNEI